MQIGILAGGQGRRLCMGPKALITIAGKPIRQRMVDELASLSSLPISMVVPNDAPEMLEVIQIESKGGYLSDLLALIGVRAPGVPLVIVNADAVLITATDIRKFISETSDVPADFFWPVVEKSSIWPERQSPRLTNYVPGTNKALARGNLMYIPGELEPNVGIAKCIDRHKALADLMVLGLRNLLKVATFSLTLADIEHRIGVLLGCRARLVRSGNPNFAFDVDVQADLDFAERMLGTRVRSGSYC